MDNHEVETLLAIAENGHPLHVKKGILDKLSQVSPEMDDGQRRRLEKVQHCVRREMDIALRTAG